MSFGGAVTLHVTLKRPDKVDKLIVVSSAGLGIRMGTLFSVGSMAPLRQYEKAGQFNKLVLEFLRPAEKNFVV